MLSFIPFLLVFLTILKYTPVITKTDFLASVSELLPENVSPVIENIVSEINTFSGATIPLNILITMWSAGQGILAIANGLNAIDKTVETRNYFFVRIRAAFYTFIILLAIILSLTLQAFGGLLESLAVKYLPGIPAAIFGLLHIRILLAMLAIVIIALVMYKFLPNKKIRFWSELPGAVFCAVGWQICSWVISEYLRIFKNFTSMYGSLTTLILVMLWLYFSMYIMLIGGQLNRWLKERFPNWRLYARDEKS